MPPAGDRFVLWSMSDAHVGSDLIKGDGRWSIVEAIEQAESSNGSDEVRVRCYLYTSQIAAQGWYPRVERTLKLRHAFQVP